MMTENRQGNRGGRLTEAENVRLVSARGYHSTIGGISFARAETSQATPKTAEAAAETPEH
jgi:hypothetical protein